MLAERAGEHSLVDQRLPDELTHKFLILVNVEIQVQNFGKGVIRKHSISPFGSFPLIFCYDPEGVGYLGIHNYFVNVHTHLQ